SSGRSRARPAFPTTSARRFRTWATTPPRSTFRPASPATSTTGTWSASRRAGRASGSRRRRSRASRRAASSASRTTGSPRPRRRSFHPLRPYGEGWHKSDRIVAAEGQPFAFTPDRVRQLEEICGKYPPDRRKSAVLAALYFVQEQQGYLTANAMRHVAEFLR